MSANAIELLLRVGGDARGAVGALGQTKGGISGLLNPSLLLKAALAAAAAGLAALTGVAVKATMEFIRFEQQMNEVFTLLPDISDQAMAEMTQQVKDFSKEFAVLPEKVVPALYQALSAGVPKDNVFEFLEVAHKAALGGVTDLETAVDGLTSVVNAYGEEVISTEQASDLMFTGVKKGKTTFGELSASLFNVIPTAAGLNVQFGDIMASLASLTAQGVPTSVATTQVRQALVELSKEGGETAQIFEQVAGKSFAQFIAEGGNLYEALQLMDGQAQKMGVSVKDLFGSVEAGSAALALTGKGAEKFAENIEDMANAAGATDKAYERMDKGLGRSFERIKVAGKVALLDLGEKLAPAVSQFADLIQQNMPMIQAVLTAAFDAIGKGVRWLIDNVITPFKEQFQSSMGGASGAMDMFKETVLPALQSIWEAIKSFVDLVMVLWDMFGKRIVDTIVATVKFIWGILEGVFKVIGGLLDVIVGIFTGDWEKVKGGLLKIGEGLIQIVMSIVNYIADRVRIVVDQILGAWQRYKERTIEKWEATKAFFVALWEFIKNLFSTALDEILNFFYEKTPLGFIIANWEQIRAFIAAVWERIKAAVSTGAQSVYDNAKKKLEELWAYIKGLPGKAYNWGRDILNNLWDGMKSIYSSLKTWFEDKVKSLLDKLNPWAKHSPSLIDQIWSGVHEIEKAYRSLRLPDMTPALAIPGGGGSSTVYEYHHGGRQALDINFNLRNVPAGMDQQALEQALVDVVENHRVQAAIDRSKHLQYDRRNRPQGGRVNR